MNTLPLFHVLSCIPNRRPRRARPTGSAALGSRFSVLGSRFSVLDSGSFVRPEGTRFFVLVVGRCYVDNPITDLANADRGAARLVAAGRRTARPAGRGASSRGAPRAPAPSGRALVSSGRRAGCAGRGGPRAGRTVRLRPRRHAGRTAHGLWHGARRAAHP